MKSIVILIFYLHISLLTASQSLPEFFVENISQEEENIINQYNDIAIDNRGLVYLANPRGIYEFDGVSWRLVSLPDNKQVNVLKADDKGKIYVGGNGQIGYLKPTLRGEMTYQSLNHILPQYFNNFRERIVNIIVHDSTITFLSDHFMFLYNAGNEDTCKVVQAPSFFYSSAAIGENIFVVDGMQGLMRFAGGAFKPVPNGRTIISYVLTPLQNNRLLMVSPNKGIVFFYPDKDSLQFMSTPNNPFLHYDIKNAIELHNGNIALGSVKNGCLVINKYGKIVYRINQNNGLSSNSIFAMEQDINGNIWLGLNNGISLVYNRKKQQLHPSGQSIPFRSFVREFKNRKNGVVYFSGTFLSSNKSVPGLIQNPEQKLAFHYKTNNYTFSFGSNQFFNIAYIEYQYFLEGMDNAWSSWSTATSCDYTNLQGGDYTFHVRARNSNHLVSKISSYQFKVNLPWYESWWFYAIQFGILISLLVVAGFLYRSGKSEKLAAGISGIVVVIVFKYLRNSINPFLAALATGIAIFDILTSVAVAYAISPAQNFTNRMFEKLVKKEEENEPENIAENNEKSQNE